MSWISRVFGFRGSLHFEEPSEDDDCVVTVLTKVRYFDGNDSERKTIGMRPRDIPEMVRDLMLIEQNISEVTVYEEVSRHTRDECFGKIAK